MPHVSWRCVAAVFETARLMKVSAGPLVEGLSFDPQSLRQHGWIDWDEYCTVIERLETLCGGPEALEAILTEHLPYQELHAIAGAFVSPLLLYRFIFRIADPLIFPPIDFLYDELPDGRIRVEYRLHPEARSCAALGRASVGPMRVIPCYLGLPPAHVEADLGDRSGVYWVTPPPSRTIASRLRRRAANQLDGLLATLHEMLGETQPNQRDRTASAAEASGPTDAAERLRRVAHAYALTPRQAEVLDGIVTGLSNKEIAARHGCAENTVELHITNLFRKLSVQSRTQLVAKFWSQP